MSELHDRLQTALGNAYKIEKELGGGGMSRVFLATETALGRRVVVKVLPPEMAAGVNIERFRREIQLAASLQHPHIVPLHAAGQVGDLFYYTMPLVEGESLRGKLAREGELPVGQAVRILCDVVDALAYAHAHGVVHRDIKPDNVLLSGNHAVVTDFGVAKAVSAASGESSLTSLGVALGTPAYMSPEQAAADPNVDHRADLYAVGVLAYEMLAGRLPFNAPNPQAMLAAHVTEAPDPPTRYRSTVPPALNELIMRCLEKKPADRVQRSEELLAQLHAMVTPSGGMTPTGATPISSGTEAALRRSRPTRVAALFGGASLAVLAVVYLLARTLGLPYWVVWGAAALLAIGFPIVLFTSRLERNRAQARASGRVVAEPALAGWVNWRRSLWGGGIAFAALAVVTTAYAAMRLLGIGPVGTLVASGALKEKQPILLADFVNRSADSTLGPTLTEAFRVDLAQSRTVKLQDAKTVAAALQRMQRPVGTPVTDALARELAEREGIKAVVTGQIDPVDKGYLLTASVVSAADGQVLTAVRASAADGSHLIEALDKLSAQLRERIGESLTTIRAAQPLYQVTTTSLEALRKYSQGIRAADAGDWDGSAAVLQEATSLDTGFAMAWRKLGVVLQNSFASRERVVAAVTRAFSHRDRLPELERQLTAAYYYDQVDSDRSKLAAAYRAALDLDPNNEVALNNLSLELTRLHQFAAAESLLIRGVNLGYLGVLYRNLVFNQVSLGQYQDAQATIDRGVRNNPRDPNIPELRAILASSQHDYASVEKFYRQLWEDQKASPSWRMAVSRALAEVSQEQGKLKDAEQHLRDVAATGDQRGQPSDYLRSVIETAWLDIRYRNRSADGMQKVTAALNRRSLQSLPASDRPYIELIKFYSGAGKPAEAERLLSEYQKAVPEGERNSNDAHQSAAAYLADAQGRIPDAMAAYQGWRDDSGCPVCAYFEMARLYERTNQPDSAVALYERLVRTPAPLRLATDAYALAPTYKRLGELYDARKDRAKALDYYGRFTDLWKNADPELQPEVRTVKERMAQLAQKE
jgi:tetratricopeptide (TPR) repeat protein